MAETLLDALADIRQRLKKDEYKNEEHVRFSLVGRVLAALGWDIWNPAEVNTEEKPHEENHTKVDISLRIVGQKLATIYLECKRVNMLVPHLPKVEKQMSDYNSKNAAGLIVLTDGRHWYLYFPFGQAPFSERRFATLNLAEDDLANVAQELTDVLGRSEVATGKAKQTAEDRWDLERRRRKIADLLPEAKHNVTRHDADRTLSQELVYLMEQEGFPDITETEVKAILAELGGGPKTAAKPKVSLEQAKGKAKELLIKLASEKEGKKPLPVAEPPAPGTGPRFKFTLKGNHATGVLLPDKKQMRVLAGSTAAGSVTNSFNKKHERDALLADGTLAPQGAMLVFTRDHVFKTARAAADIVYASPVNARTAWRHEATDEPIGNFLAANQSKA